MAATVSRGNGKSPPIYWDVGLSRSPEDGVPCASRERTVASLGTSPGEGRDPSPLKKHCRGCCDVRDGAVDHRRSPRGVEEGWGGGEVPVMTSDRAIRPPAAAQGSHPEHPKTTPKGPKGPQQPLAAPKGRRAPGVPARKGEQGPMGRLPPSGPCVQRGAKSPAGDNQKTKQREKESKAKGSRGP